MILFAQRPFFSKPRPKHFFRASNSRFSRNLLYYFSPFSEFVNCSFRPKISFSRKSKFLLFPKTGTFFFSRNLTSPFLQLSRHLTIKFYGFFTQNFHRFHRRVATQQHHSLVNLRPSATTTKMMMDPSGVGPAMSILHLGSGGMTTAESPDNGNGVCSVCGDKSAGRHYGVSGMGEKT